MEARRTTATTNSMKAMKRKEQLSSTLLFPTPSESFESQRLRHLLEEHVDWRVVQQQLRSRHRVHRPYTSFQFGHIRGHFKRKYEQPLSEKEHERQIRRQNGVDQRIV